MNTIHEKTRRMTGLAILSALIIVLQILCTFIKFGPVSITLALVPIIVGAAVFLENAGAFLGFVLGLVVLLCGMTGWDGGFVLYLFGINPVPCLLVILLKSTLAGFAAEKIYQWLRPRGEKKAVLFASIACPVINTGIFIASMFLFFLPALRGFAYANGQSLIVYALTGLVGVNFLVELAVNVGLSSAVTYIVKTVAGRKTI